MIHEISTGRYGTAIRKLLGLRGGYPTAISNELAGHLDIESDRPEWKFLTGTRIGRITVSQIAVAAQNSFAGLQLTNSLRVLVVVTYVRAWTSAGAGRVLLTLNGPPPSVTAGGVRSSIDSRYDQYVFAQNVVSVGVTGSRAGVAGNTIDDAPCGATGIEFFSLPGQALAILGPNTNNLTILAWNGTVNQDIFVTVGFYERDLDSQSEVVAP